MSLEITINTDIKAAMLAKNEIALRSLRAVKAAILLAKTAENAKSELSEEDEMKILQKLAKQRKDSISIFEEQNRTDLATIEKEELGVIEKYLPAPFTADELKLAVQAIIEQVGATGPSDLGKVMGVASKQLSGKADGKAISALVKDILTK